MNERNSINIISIICKLSNATLWVNKKRRDIRGVVGLNHHTTDGIRDGGSKTSMEY